MKARIIAGLPPRAIANKSDPYERARELARRFIAERGIEIPAYYPKAPAEPEAEIDDGKVVSLLRRQAT